MLITGEVQEFWSNSRVNLACIVPEKDNTSHMNGVCDSVVYRLNKWISIDKDIKETFLATGMTSEVKLTIGNPGGQPMTNFTVTDTLPDGLEYVVDSASHT